MKFTASEMLTMLVCGGWLGACALLLGPTALSMAYCGTHHRTFSSNASRPVDPACPWCQVTLSRTQAADEQVRQLNLKWWDKINDAN